jgi:hypothetical protein
LFFSSRLRAGGAELETDRWDVAQALRIDRLIWVIKEFTQQPWGAAERRDNMATVTNNQVLCMRHVLHRFIGAVRRRDRIGCAR